MGMWQRPARVGVGAFVVAFAVVVFFGIRDRSVPASAVVIERADPEAVAETTGVDIVQADDSGKGFDLRADKQLAYADGRMHLDTFSLRVPPEAEEAGLEMAARQATMSGDQTRFEAEGDVRLTTTDGLFMTSAEAVYDRVEGIIRMPGSAEIVRRELVASGREASYDRRRDVLEFLHEARVRVTRAEGGAVEIHSERATLAETGGYMQFEGGVAVDSGTERWTAESATMLFQGDPIVLQRLELVGGAAMTSLTPVAGGPRRMRAETIAMSYDPLGQVVQQALLTGGAAVSLVGADPGRGSEIASGAIDVRLAADGRSVRELSARETVSVTFPPRPNAALQQIRARTLEAKGEPGRGLRSALFEGAVEYREQPPGSGSVERVARAERLEATLGEDAGGLGAARFVGDASYRDGQTAAEGDELAYDVTAGRVEVRTLGSAGRVPRVVDRRGSIEAERIELAIGGGELRAEGRVRSVLNPTDRSVATDADATRRPAMLEGDAPVYLSSDKLSYAGDPGVATYAGHARLWQGETEIQAETIDVDEKTGNLKAQGTVRTRSMLARTTDGRPAQPALTTGQASALQYDDATRRVTYQTGARVNGPQGDLGADTIAIHLGTDGKQVSQVAATGSVRWHGGDRWAFGATMTYFDAEDRYEMTGSPVRIVEQMGAECQETRGRTLTFYRSTATIAVDGQLQNRTLTTRGPCPELKFE